MLKNNKKFLREESEKEMSALRKAFKKHFDSLGYKEKPPMKVTDAKKVAATTRFIGSHTSVMKPDIFSGNIPQGGYYITLDTLGTRNLKTYAQEDTPIARPSAFECHGLISHYHNLSQVIHNVESYFIDVLDIGEKMIYQINPIDTDLIEAASKTIRQGEIHIGTLPLKKTRHNFGDPRLSGRDIRIEMKGNTTKPVAVIIAMDIDQEPCYLETTIAPCSLLQQTYDLEHCLDTFPVPTIGSPNKTLERKLEDSLVTVDLLTKEGLKPGGSENKGKLLRKYFNFLAKAANELGINHEKLNEMVSAYQEIKYGALGQSGRVMQHLPTNPNGSFVTK